MPGKRVLAACVLAAVVGLCVFAASPTRAASAPEPIQLVEGSVVTLPQVLVTLTGQNWFFAKPLYASGPTIAVWADADPPPTSGWTVNVTGRVLSASGKLFVYATRLELLIDPRTQMPCPPPVAGSVWADLRDIPLNLDAPTEGLVPPDPSSLIPIREPVEAAPGSIALALTRSDAGAMTAMDVGHGSPDSSQVTLTEKVVTATRADFAPGYMYVEETNRTAGIRVKWSGAYEPTRGDVVDVSGVIDTASDGERVIDADTGTPHGVTFVQTGTPLTPLGMTNRSLGGGPFGPYSPGVDGGVGLFNKGLLVKTTGRVSSIDEPNKLFYITDGSLPDALKVSWDWPAGRPSIVPPQVGWKIGVTGLASSEVSGASMLRVLRPRAQSDLGVYEPVDTTDPTVEITSPKGTTWHKASGATFIVISGTADDDDTCVVKVEVKIDGGQYQPAIYDPVAKTWQYTWSPATFPASTTIQAKATDFAGNDAESAEITVTISSVNVVYLNCARPGNSGSGLSWTTAKKTFRDYGGTGAISAASTGWDVWAVEGTYSEQVNNGKGLLLYGGFLGAETVREQQNWSANETVLSGGSLSLWGSATGTVDGFIIQDQIGSGISCGGPALIAHNIIRRNHASGNGGGVSVNNCSNVVIANNVIIANSAQRGGGIALFFASAEITNNTIVSNSSAGSGGGIFLDNLSTAVLTNNIVAHNSGWGFDSLSLSTLTFQKNDFFDNGGYHYKPGYTIYPVGTDLVPIDPGIPNPELGYWHIWWGSPCRDAGLDTVTLPVEWDIDGEARRNGPIDIGADETNECWRYSVELTPEARCVPVGTSVLSMTLVLDSVPDTHPASGTRVDVSVDAGEILSVSPDEHFLNEQHTTGYGTTDATGHLSVTVTRYTAGVVNLTVSTGSCGDQGTKTVQIEFYDPESTVYKVGFLYNLCVEDENAYDEFIDAYLARVAAVYDNVDYQRIADISSGVDSSFNTVFVAMPERELTSSELVALSAFVRSGRQKRVVLVGEHNGNSNEYTIYNSRLNTVALAIGMLSRFSTGTEAYDPNPGRWRNCTVNDSDYLMAGVSSLWMALTGAFPVWQGYARPLSYVFSNDTLVWAIEEDTATTGSRVASHDPNFMIAAYGDQYDIVPDKNFKFVHNLCTVFPQ